MEMHGNKYGAIFKDITYLLRRKKKKTGRRFET